MLPNQDGLVGTGSKGYTECREPCLTGRLANTTPRDRQGTTSTSSILSRCSGLYSHCVRLMIRQAGLLHVRQYTPQENLLMTSDHGWVTGRVKLPSGQIGHRDSSRDWRLFSLSQYRPPPLDVSLGTYPRSDNQPANDRYHGPLERVIVTPARFSAPIK